jgi:hypothetical protein
MSCTRCGKPDWAISNGLCRDCRAAIMATRRASVAAYPPDPIRGPDKLAELNRVVADATARAAVAEEQRDLLLAACKAAMPWVLTATAYRSNIHPDAVRNHAEDLAKLRAAIAAAEQREATNAEA